MKKSMRDVFRAYVNNKILYIQIGRGALDNKEWDFCSNSSCSWYLRVVNNL
jgi:hypothetical protein